MGVYARREILFDMIENNSEVEAIFVYEEAHCGFTEPHSFMVICKDKSCRRRWDAEIDSVDYQIYDRIVLTKSGADALVHFDGATHHAYKTPPKAWETVYCRREPTPFECAYRWMDPDMELHEYVVGKPEDGSFKVEWRGEDESQSSAIVATTNIPAGSYIMPSHLASSLLVSDDSISNLKHNAAIGDDTIIEDLLAFFDKNGHSSNQEGIGMNYVEVGASFLMRKTSDASQANVGRWVPAHPSGKRPIYSPVYERNRISFDVFLVATKDIKAGQEVVKLEGIWQE